MQGKERWRGIGKPCIASQVHTDAVHGLHVHVRRPRPVLPMHSCPALRGGWPRRRYHARAAGLCWLLAREEPLAREGWQHVHAARCGVMRRVCPPPFVWQGVMEDRSNARQAACRCWLLAREEPLAREGCNMARCIPALAPHSSVSPGWSQGLRCGARTTRPRAPTTGSWAVPRLTRVVPCRRAPGARASEGGSINRTSLPC